MAMPALNLVLPAPRERKLVSIIAPVYNEEEVLEEFLNRIVATISSLDNQFTFEIILVDDGSRDRSLEVMKQYCLREPRLRVIELSRNYGQTPALQAGLDQARGEIFITMDADLQHFPEEIPVFLSRLEQGQDLVCGWRHERQEGVIRRWPSRAANYLIRRISGLHIHDFGTTYRAYRADLARDLRLFGEFHRYIPVLCHLPEIADRPKQGFSIPVHAWVRGPFAETLRDLLSPASLGRLEVLEPEPIQHLMNQHLSGRCSLGFELWGLAVLVAWHRARIERQPAMPSCGDIAEVKFPARPAEAA